MPERSNNCKRLFIAHPHGFCNGVHRALKCVLDLLPVKENNVYVYNEIVHNSFVVNNLKKSGVRFVCSLDDIPTGSITVWSAHGVPPQLEKEAQAKGLKCIDATCPLVKKVHDLAEAHSLKGDAVIFIGHKKHPETVGVMGCGDIYVVSSIEDCPLLPDFPPERQVVVLTQTTLCSEDVHAVISELEKRYKNLQTLSDICYATGERQLAVRQLAEKNSVEHVLVIGSPNSSNSRRLCEVAESCNMSSQLIDDPQEIANMDFSNIERLGITAGASAPEILLEQAVSILKEKHNFVCIESGQYE